MLWSSTLLAVCTGCGVCLCNVLWKAAIPSLVCYGVFWSVCVHFTRAILRPPLWILLLYSLVLLLYIARGFGHLGIFAPVSSWMCFFLVRLHSSATASAMLYEKTLIPHLLGVPWCLMKGTCPWCKSQPAAFANPAAGLSSCYCFTHCSGFFSSFMGVGPCLYGQEWLLWRPGVVRSFLTWATGAHEYLEII